MAQPMYAAPQVQSVAEMIDPSRPLVRSDLPLTQPKAPKFVDPTEAERRRQDRQRKKDATNEVTSKIHAGRISERKFLKAQYEFDREKRLAEQTIYRKEQSHAWKSKFANSPFLVDLVADNERIEEEMYVRNEEERRRKKKQEAKKKAVKNEVIMKALSEVPQLEQARAQKRAMLEEEKRLKAMKDVDRVHAVYEQKVFHQQQMEEDRKERRELGALKVPVNKRR
eukprot:NODE_4182_length_807_cov_54.485294_g4159_i0.p1 GENE.NODE_4182_length_807_cov_54.485294_g4159_i0~~NODE_4182_length_807_cov_54.485294_g4159_i0.p1  ORF type:complete len:225 (+),score=59.17 NODE_4182_length_807_cov_54.485294_g4159_i0:48-722(+)